MIPMASGSSQHAGVVPIPNHAEQQQEDCDMATDKVPFWVVWNPNGNGPQYRYADQIAAEIEAERLAEGNPGKEIYVLEPICVVCRKQAEIKRYVPR
jgi:hypothetical protein